MQSTLPQGERRTSAAIIPGIAISIHAPTRGATVMPEAIRPDNMVISIHAPTRGATQHSFHYSLFQSTLPQGERQYGLILYALPEDISIHAPTRGAEHSWMRTLAKQAISIHAPTRGATIILRSHNHLQISKHFNPRSHKGSEQQFYTKFHICFISFLPILSPYHTFHTQPASDF